MPDERTYGFSLRDATEFVNGIGSSEGWYPEIKPRGGKKALGGDYIIFQFVEPEESSSGSSSGSGPPEEEGLPEECEFREPAVGPFLASVSRLGCGMESAPGADENNLIEVHDLIGIMDNRDIRDIIGREGIAIRMQNSEIESGSVSLSVNDDCIWVIVIVNFWRIVKVVSDFIYDGKDITVKYKNITVWDDCQLPDEVIEGIDCEESSASGSA
jgi:hypothetical protein